MTDGKKRERTAAPDAKEYHEKHTARGEGEPAVAESTPRSLKQNVRQFLDWYVSRPKFLIGTTVVLVLVLFLAVPFTRYMALGLFLKQDFPVVVLDSQTSKPVSSAQVFLRGKSANTDGQGKAVLRVPVGGAHLSVSKTYYNSASASVTVPLKKSSEPFVIKLEAVGRPVPVTVTNKITGQPVAGATVTVGKSQSKTDKKGETVLVVPVGDSQPTGVLAADGYNKTQVSIKLTIEDNAANHFTLTPSGKVYFLSNQSGKIDVVESDLDGGSRKVIVAGTGKEAKSETVLLATRDWKYLALQSKRDGGTYAKLYLIDTASGSMTTMDEGEATFTLTGWDNHYFIYTVSRNNVNQWDPKRQALKSYNADTKKIATLDETTAAGNQYDYVFETIDNAYVLNHQIVYAKDWSGSAYASFETTNGKEATLNSITPSKDNKRMLKAFSLIHPGAYVYIETRPYGANELYIRFNAGDKDRFYEYDNGQVSDLPNLKSDDFYDLYSTYLASPSGNKTFWSESRDGKLAFFVGDSSGGNEERVATLSSGYQVYGWYTDNYLLVSKGGSELFIMPAGGVENETQLVKVTDYYKPYYSYAGYGGGYGGL